MRGIFFQKTKIMTTEEIHNFNLENEDIEIVKDFTYLGSVINSNRDCSQEIKKRLRLGRRAREELEKNHQSTDVSLETKAKIIPTLVFPINMYGCESWTV